MRFLSGTLLVLGCVCGGLTSAHAGAQLSFTDLRVLADPDGGPGFVARVNYYCGRAIAWDATSTVATQGNTISITVSDSSGLACIGTPPPVADVDVAIGPRVPGNYTLILQQAPLPPATAPTLLLSKTFSVGQSLFSNLRVIPNPAFTGQSIAARATFDCSRGFFSNPPAVVVQGSTVLLRFAMQSDAGPCFAGVPPPPLDQDFALGALAAGNYTLILQQQSGTAGVVVQSLSTPFTVLGAQSALAVPGDAAWALALLAVLVLVMGRGMLRNRT